MSNYSIILELIKSFGVTLEIFIVTTLLSIPLGILVSLARMSKNTVLKKITEIYISIMRGTPLMLQLICVYFGPFYILGVSTGSSYRYMAIFIAFTINYAAYFGEIFRSGIQSMDIGQYEAAKLLGYSKSQTFMRIILPQVVKNVTPAVANEIITLVKDTSFAYTISVMDMFTRAKALAAGQTSVAPLFFAGVLYYVFNYAVALSFNKIEKKLSYYR